MRLHSKTRYITIAIQAMGVNERKQEMHTYKKNRGDDLWTVGYFEVSSDADGTVSTWRPLRDFSNESSAEAYVNYLNGGDGNLFVEPNV